MFRVKTLLLVPVLALAFAGCGGAKSVSAVNLKASPTSVTSGANSILTWSSNNMTSCSASGTWSGTKETSGSESSGALNTVSIFNLACTGSGGTGSASVAVTVLPPPGPLAWVNALALGQWYEIPNTAMSSIDPSPVPPGSTGPAAKVVAWTSFVVDTRNSNVLSVATGGHDDYGGNEVDALHLEVAAPFWEQLLAPSTNASIQSGDYYLDGRPTSRHTYYGVTLNVFDDRVMLFGGSRYADGNLYHKVDSYNITANNYSAAGTHPDTASNFLGVQACAVDPSTGDVYLSQDFLLARWSRLTNTFQTLSPSGSGPQGFQTMAAFDTSRGRILFVGGGNSDHHIYTLSSNTWSAITLNGANAPDVSGAGQTAMVYVPAIDRFLIRKDGAGGTVYQVDPSTFEVTTFVTTGGTSVPLTQNGPFNKFLYVQRLGGAVYIPTYSGNAWFLRLH